MAARSLAQDTYLPDSQGQPVPPTNTPPQNGNGPQRIKRKRHRVPVACFSCRALKTKCDGNKPVCSTCTSHGYDCQYSSNGISTSSTVVMVNQQYLHTLEERLAKLEQGTARESPKDQTSPYSDPGSIRPGPAPSRRAHILNPEFSHSNLSNNTRPIMDVDLGIPDASPSEGPIVVSADPDVFMGGLSFTQLILNAMNGRTFGIRAHNSRHVADEPLPPSVIFNLPDETREILYQFFQINHAVSPVFHEPTIRIAFEAAINSPMSERHHHRQTLALLNMIFAVCLSHRPMDHDTNPSISRRYYDIAMELLKPTLLREWNIAKVQALVLGARYLQCSNSPDECWNVLGLAVRIAQGLDLHRSSPHDKDGSEKEVRKRVWWACFTLDKLLSMIYGRPAASNSAENTCTLPEDLGDECIFVDRIIYPNPRRVSEIRFSIEVVKLYGILETATRSMDLEATNASPAALAQNILALDERFQRWYAEVPPELKLEDDDDETAEKPLILALRANMVRMFIHRPSLAQSLRALGRAADPKTANEGMKGSILQHSRSICVSTAMETVNLIGRRHESTKWRSGTGWFDLYYLFNATLILVSHVLDPAYHNTAPCIAQLEIGLAMIKTMTSNHDFARKAYSFLQQLIGCMNKSTPAALMRVDGGPPATNVPMNQHGILGPIPVNEMGGIGIGENMGVMGGGMVPDGQIYTELTGFTHDLSEMYADLGSEMMAWFDGQGGAMMMYDPPR